MALLIGFLTFILVVNCLFLMLLVLVQLPKKEAGAGLAFGAGAVDTLIGAGSGNALTKLTKYAAASFLGLAVLLAVMNAQRHQAPSRSLQEQLAKKSSAAPMLPPAQPAKTAATPPTDVTTPAATPVTSNANNGAAAPPVNLQPVAAPAATPQPSAVTNK